MGTYIRPGTQIGSYDEYWRSLVTKLTKYGSSQRRYKAPSPSRFLLFLPATHRDNAAEYTRRNYTRLSHSKSVLLVVIPQRARSAVYTQSRAAAPPVEWMVPLVGKMGALLGC